MRQDFPLFKVATPVQPLTSLQTCQDLLGIARIHAAHRTSGFEYLALYHKTSGEKHELSITAVDQNKIPIARKTGNYPSCKRNPLHITLVRAFSLVMYISIMNMQS